MRRTAGGPGTDNERTHFIYVETTIPSFYHETRAQAQFQAMREWTSEWWDLARLRDELVTSEAVRLELGRVPPSSLTIELRRKPVATVRACVVLGSWSPASCPTGN